MPKIVSLQRRGSLVLPADIRRRHHLDESGAQVQVTERADGVIELLPLAAIPADQQWFWTDRWQAMERAADDDIAAGHTESFDDVDALLDDLG